MYFSIGYHPLILGEKTIVFPYKYVVDWLPFKRMYFNLHGEEAKISMIKIKNAFDNIFGRYGGRNRTLF